MSLEEWGVHAIGIGVIGADLGKPGVGVTKPTSSVPLFSQFFIIVKTYFNSWISRLYLTSVAVAQLWRNLLDMNVIRGI